ncbi:hypothetical protein C4D60_Mb04t37650 [Musa balbisiana]|uniref:Uncharacterized protein n=1 Tax=Musa balbisiana TaxID=52838 RepID=A0A4S8KHR3_MUSBA|nr:hypothetical protein C4D60_Mb04t37650 [Musa balbisiana]
MKSDPFIHIQVVRLVQIVDKEMASKCGANWQNTEVHMMCSSPAENNRRDAKMAACLSQGTPFDAQPCISVLWFVFHSPEGKG